MMGELQGVLGQGSSESTTFDDIPSLKKAKDRRVNNISIQL